MTTQVFQTLEELGALRPEWDILLEAYPQSTIFSSWEWLSSWWRAFGKTQRLRVLGVRDPSSRLVALAPFAISEMKSLVTRWRVLRLMGDGTHDSDNLDMPVQSGSEKQVALLLLEWMLQSPEWDICQLNTMPAESAVGRELLATLKARGWNVFTSERPQTVIELPATWEAYLQSLSSKERGKVGIRFRKLGKKYKIDICKCREASELEPALQSLYELHGKHWLLRGLPGTLHVTARQGFYHELANLLLARNRLDFWLLKANDKVVAAQFGLRYGNTVFSLQEGFDPEYAADSVGYVLRSQVLKNLISDGIRRYDFLGGTDESKVRWGGTVKSYMNLEFAPPRSRGALYLSLKHKSAAAKATIREHLPKVVLRGLKRLKGSQAAKKFDE